MESNDDHIYIMDITVVGFLSSKAMVKLGEVEVGKMVWCMVNRVEAGVSSPTPVPGKVQLAGAEVRAGTVRRGDCHKHEGGQRGGEELGRTSCIAEPLHGSVSSVLSQVISKVNEGCTNTNHYNQEVLHCLCQHACQEPPLSPYLRVQDQLELEVCYQCCD